MKKTLMLLPYAALWRLARPLLRRHKRMAEGFEQRLVPAGWPLLPAGAEAASGALAEASARTSATALKGIKNPARPLPCRLWLHAASGGEAYLVREIVAELSQSLKAKQKNMGILCTSMTSQGVEVLARVQDELSAPHCSITVNYMPLDEPKLMLKAVRQAFAPPDAKMPAGQDETGSAQEPKALVLLETEIWPGLLWAARSAGVKPYILNGRMTPGSFKSYQHIKGTLRKLAPDSILASSADDALRFQAVFDVPGCPSRVRQMPNIKFDRVAPVGRSYVSPLHPLLDAARPQVALFASVREEEEGELAGAIFKLRRQAPHLCLIVAPRHLHRAEAWAEVLAGRADSDFKRRSQGISSLKGGDVVLWDSFGELMSLYGIADVVFVGGSLAPLGGQNFLEPLSFGLCPIIGSSWSNFYWAGRDIFELGLVRQVCSGAELPEAMLAALQERRAKEAVKADFAHYLQQYQGGSRQAAEFLLQALF